MNKNIKGVVIGLIIISALFIGGYYIYSKFISPNSKNLEQVDEARGERYKRIKENFSFITPAKDVTDSLLLGKWVSDTDDIQIQKFTWLFSKEGNGLTLRCSGQNHSDKYSVNVSSNSDYPGAFEGVGSGESLFFHAQKEWKVYFYYLKDKDMIIEADGQPAPTSDERLDFEFRRSLRNN